MSSDVLGEKVMLRLKERAEQGRRVGGIPFGYASCWIKEHGKRGLSVARSILEASMLFLTKVMPSAISSSVTPPVMSPRVSLLAI